MEKEIVIKPNFASKDYYKIDRYLLLNRPFLWICTIAMFFSVLTNLLTGNVDFGLKGALFYLVAVGFLFYVTHRNTKKKLQNFRLKEEIYYKVTAECMEDVGESFNTKYFWKNIIKIVEKKEWFLIYITKNCAKVIRKDDLKDNQYNELKQLFNLLNVQKSLK